MKTVRVKSYKGTEIEFTDNGRPLDNNLGSTPTTLWDTIMKMAEAIVVIETAKLREGEDEH